VLRGRGKLRGSKICKVQFSSSSQPDKNLYACVCLCVLVGVSVHVKASGQLIRIVSIIGLKCVCHLTLELIRFW